MRSRLSNLTMEFVAARPGALNRAGNERADRNQQAGNGVRSDTAPPNSLERRCVKAECHEFQTLETLPCHTEYPSAWFEGEFTTSDKSGKLMCSYWATVLLNRWKFECGHVLECRHCGFEPGPSR